MDRIRAAFAEMFSAWGITLPENIERDGVISEAGWSIRYHCAEDEQGEPTLELLAENRMTNSSRTLISADGTVTALESFADSYAFDPDDPEGAAAARAEMEAHNERVAEDLRKRGML